MDAAQWRESINQAIAKNDDEWLDLFAKHLAACDRAKQILRKKGYGVTGTPVDYTAEQVPCAEGWEE